MRISGFALLWLLVGVVVAAINDYFDHLGTVRRVLEAAIAVIIWPLILAGLDIDIK